MKPFFIRLREQHGPYRKGTFLRCIEVVPHGGHYDCEAQYVCPTSYTPDGKTYVPSDHAEVMNDDRAFIVASFAVAWNGVACMPGRRAVVERIPVPSYIENDERGVLRAVWK